MTRTTTGKYDDGAPSSAASVVKRTAGDKGFEDTWEISAVGKTFTYTELDAGVTKPSIIVFDKQVIPVGQL